MGMRVTTGMAMNTYRHNLQTSTINKNNSMNAVLTHRKFNSFGENPAAATQAWRVRRAMVNADIYLGNNSDTYTRFNIAWNALGQAAHDLTDLDGRSAAIYAANDPTASGRPALGQVLRQTAESVIQTMNSAKSGENFVFSGDDELNAPFSWQNGQLYYRGVNVNAGSVKSPAQAPDWAPTDANGEPADNTDTAALANAYRATLPQWASNPDNPDSEAWEQAWVDYYQDPTKAQPNPANYTTADFTPTAPPSWVPRDAGGNQLTNSNADMKQAFVDSLPDPADNDVDQAWVDYYKDTTGTVYKPTVNPEQVWAAARGVDDYGSIKDVKSIITDPNASSFDKAWAAYFADQSDVKKLDAMSKEQATIDLGMGMLEDENGKLIDGTYFDRSLPGINMLGYGYDKDGDPKNVCMIMIRLAEIYENCDPNTGDYDKDTEKAVALQEEAMRLVNKLKDGQASVAGQYTEVSAKGSFLEQNETRLELQKDYLDEQRAEIEDVDLAQAITQFSWDYYCYSAALKVGTQLLSQSLIDYMS